MKKIIIISSVVLLSGFLADPVSSQLPDAQPQMMGNAVSSNDWQEILEHTAREEKEGQELWSKLQNKEISCTDLDDENFGVLGEYFMGQMMGDAHASMNAMMMQAHGKEGEAKMHIVMGKRLSGCDTSAEFPANMMGLMPMMQMFSPGWSGMMGYGWNNLGFMAWPAVFWITLLLLWTALTLLIIFLARRLKQKDQ